MEFVGGRSTEKGVTNTLLDEMRMPAIWIANTPADAMDESVRRRFDYSVYFRRINRFQRVSTWRNLVRKFDLERKIPEAAIEEYVARYPTSPGGISNVLNNVKRLDPPVEEVEEIIASLMRTHCELMGIQNDSDFLPTRGYDLEGLNIKGQVGLPRIVQALRNFLDPDYHDEDQDPPRMNLLLFGPPGTGKTEFVKFLGKELGCRVKVVRGSDILSRWVGASEQNIAAAFAEAEESHAILFFDEVDGLVQDRAGASQSWEVTQVNEFLQQMEQFDGIMVAATNFSRNLDKAMTRRFTYKLEFGYLDEEGKRVFFERVFKAKLTPTELEELRSLHNLTPGDFRTVRQSLFYLDDAQTNAARIAALREECTRKRDGQGSGTVGF